MKLTAGHRWNLTPQEAVRLQARLRQRLGSYDPCGTIHTIDTIRHVAGVDVGFERSGAIARAAVAVLTFPDLIAVDCALAREPVRFPYIPGLLSFRELPVILKALRRLTLAPDALLCDGHGYAHPRRFGLACHLGSITDLPAIGVAKTLLTGTHGPVPARRGGWAPLAAGSEIIGAVLRSREGVTPIYVSTGHRLSLTRAIELVMACTTRYRLPETTRWAHRLASSSASDSARIQRTVRAARGLALHKSAHGL